MNYILKLISYQWVQNCQNDPIDVEIIIVCTTWFVHTGRLHLMKSTNIKVSFNEHASQFYDFLIGQLKRFE